MMLKKDLVYPCHFSFNKLSEYIVMKTQQVTNVVVISQPAITCSKLTIETLEQGVKYVQSQQ